MTSYKVKPDSALLQSEMITRGVSVWLVNLLIPLLQSFTKLAFSNSNVSWFAWFHCHCLVDFSVSLRFSINLRVSAERQKVDWLTNPMNPRIPRRFLGLGYLLKLSTWFREGRTPLCDIRKPKICTSFLPTSSFDGLNTIL